MPSTFEIVKDLKNFEPNGVPAAIEIATRIGSVVPVVPDVEYFELDGECIDENNNVFVSAKPSIMDHYALARDCSVIEKSDSTKLEIVKMPLSIWMRQIVDSTGIKLSDSTHNLMVSNTGAIIRHRIDLIYSRFGVDNG
jgi:hypothetical protein